MKSSDIGKAETAGEEEDGVDLGLVCLGFELGEGDIVGIDAHHGGVYQGGRCVAAGEAGDELGIGDDLLVGGDGAVKVGGHAGFQLSQAVDAPRGGILVVEQVCARIG